MIHQELSSDNGYIRLKRKKDFEFKICAAHWIELEPDLDPKPQWIRNFLKSRSQSQIQITRLGSAELVAIHYIVKFRYTNKCITVITDIIGFIDIWGIKFQRHLGHHEHQGYHNY